MFPEADNREPCGRPIKATGVPCTSRQDQFVPVACFSHMNRAERAERKKLSEEHEAARQLRWEALEPSCWLWVVPTDEELKASFLRQVSFDQESEKVQELLGGYMESRESLAWFAFEEWHNERCALCGRRPTPLVLDHDHATGLVRGYLCRPCNFSEGLNRTSQVGPYAKYHTRNPATIMGITMAYTDGWGREVRDHAPPGHRM